MVIGRGEFNEFNIVLHRIREGINHLATKIYVKSKKRFNSILNKNRNLKKVPYLAKKDAK